ncbi:MAG TPA: N-acetylmuramic acid 6-phosphate etherase [Polyangia bacterium]|nr:N-acetylmuramic acid 6-phosphate etherase [Polyangia bacterium]
MATRRSKRTRPDYARLATEAPHPKSAELESLPAEELVALLVGEERRAQQAAWAARKEIARAAERVAAALRAGGRLFYVGAGTSGRLGALDAAELPPTFGSSREQVIAVVAGGPRALQRSIEGAEDRPQQAAQRLGRLGLDSGDVVCAIAASGVTPFARAALEFARTRGAATLFVTCAPDVAPDAADIVIAAPVGPEVLAGSTRLKGGSATKMILNALSTTTMVALGKVYRGRMVDVVATNDKLRDRARRIVCELCRVDERSARSLLKRAGGKVKLAIAMHALGLPAAETAERLAAAGDDLHRLFEGANERRRAGATGATRKRRRR